MFPFEEERAPRHAVGAVHGVPLGALVATTDGNLPVEYLTTGDQILSPDGGAARLRSITSRRVVCKPIQISAGSFSLDGRYDTLSIPPDQRLVISDWRARALFKTLSASVPARLLVDGQFVLETEERELVVFDLDLGKTRLVAVSGLSLVIGADHQTQLDMPATGTFRLI